ncbi:hypothetical protein DWX43_19295 [Clostridium sp. AF19-22AC]|jgi:hypothetical protein|uniref:hypothetical protein n=1 Tax=Clostridia TaxID=186801 RepID=UPI000E49718E|nr:MULTISPECIES: hypothetical protein [Clostridia]RHR24789.1 hypothetical protein DWX43_19295 [Clostridium sp. AF19-22AC]DAQ34329.1 MAG TPA: hypothetical protein [Caudoviricetes sp.]
MDRKIIEALNVFAERLWEKIKNTFVSAEDLNNAAGIPIATEDKVGVVKGGDNVGIRKDGMMYVDGVNEINSITNIMIDDICK